ncbi:MAG: hypothetical protein IJF80_04640 [Clostridia bacterium]|nr:hypothetical protein [Clostridia bacterium]
MKRTVALVLVVLLSFYAVGCASVQSAEKLKEKGQYAKALEMLKKVDSEESRALLVPYTEAYAQQLIKDGEYQKAKDILLELGDASYDKLLLGQSNCGLLYEIIKEKGTKGNEGKRIYTPLDDEEVLYLEITDDNTLVLGLDFENTVGAAERSIKIYIDGKSNNPYCEFVHGISMNLLGVSMIYRGEGFGRITNKTPNSKSPIFEIDLEKYSETGNNKNGNLKEVAVSINNESIKKMLSKLPSLVSQNGLQISSVNELGIF